MSTPHVPEPAGLILGVLTATPPLIIKVIALLEPEYGPIEECVGPLDFTFTSYYDAELGPNIKRWLISFENLINRERLAAVKLYTNDVEKQLSPTTQRTVNLDPGLLTLGNFVLATGKNNAHRIYLSRGIFADLTLIFRAKTFNPLPWTYPDYADPDMIQLLNRLRENYKCKLTQTVQTI